MAAETPKNHDRKFSIEMSDLESAETAQVVDHIKRAQDVPLVREVGVETRNYGALLTLMWLSLGGIAGGLLAWLSWQIMPSDLDSFASNLLAAFTIGAFVAFAIIMTDALQSGTFSKVGKALLIGLPSAIVISLIMGLIANAIYGAMVESLYERLVNQGLSPNQDAFWTAFANQNHLNRGLAWMLIGLGAGLAVGISSLAWKRILVAGAGGLVGGFLGGFLFDFFTGEAAAQVVGLIVTGLAVGVGIGLMEQATKTSWLEIVQGGMAGKQFILFKPQITLGSSPAADVTLIKDPAIPGVAARISRRGSSVTITSLEPQNPISVNGQAAQTIRLEEGAVIGLGATRVRYRERGKNQVTAGVRR